MNKKQIFRKISKITAPLMEAVLIADLLTAPVVAGEPETNTTDSEITEMQSESGTTDTETSEMQSESDTTDTETSEMQSESDATDPKTSEIQSGSDDDSNTSDKSNSSDNNKFSKNRSASENSSTSKNNSASENSSTSKNNSASENSSTSENNSASENKSTSENSSASANTISSESGRLDLSFSISSNGVSVPGRLTAGNTYDIEMTGTLPEGYSVEYTPSDTGISLTDNEDGTVVISIPVSTKNSSLEIVIKAKDALGSVKYRGTIRRDVTIDDVAPSLGNLEIEGKESLSRIGNAISGRGGVTISVFVDDCVADKPSSGIDSVELIAYSQTGTRLSFEMTPDSGRYTAELNNVGSYTIKDIVATDNCGNIGKYSGLFGYSAITYPVKVTPSNGIGTSEKIDDRQLFAVGEGSEMGNYFISHAGVDDPWYSATAYENDTLTLTMAVKSDDLSLKSSDFYLKAREDESEDVIACDDIKSKLNYNNWSYFYQSWLNDSNTYTLTFYIDASVEACDEYDLYLDKYGVQTRVNAEDKPVLIRIDNDSPVIDNNIKVTAKGSSTVSYYLGVKYEDGIIYSSKDVDLTISANDALAEKSNHNGKYSSGIRGISYNVIDDDGDIILNAGGFFRNYYGETPRPFTVKLGVPSGGEGMLFIKNASVYDWAGNRTYINGRGGADPTCFILDNKAPTFEYKSVDGNPIPESAYSDSEEKALYFNHDVEGSILMKESYPDLSSIEVTAVNGFDKPAISSFPSYSPDDKKSEYSFNYTVSNEGDYLFDISGKDMCANQSSAARSPHVIVDKTAPDISVEYSTGGHEVTPEGKDKSYYGNSVKVTVKITDKHLDPAKIEASVDGTKYDGTSFSEEFSSGDFSYDASAAKWTASKTLDADGVYYVSAKATDRAGNESDRFKGSEFTVDRTSPEVSINFDNNSPTNEKYYKSARTATIRVKDYTFSENQTELVINSSDVAPALSAWSNEGMSHTMTVTFDHDGIYDLSFKTTDKAGNGSEEIRVASFVIDTTAPRISVVFDNKDAVNDSYYNSSRKATIVVDELSFDKNMVAVTTQAATGMKMNALPAVSAFASTQGGETHTASLSFESDGNYGFLINASDLAGNTAETYVSDIFTIDKTAPELSIEGVMNYSANNGTVAPVIKYSDDNISGSGVEISLKGANNGTVEPEFSDIFDAGKHVITFADFKHIKENDDLYSLVARVKDKAGNEVEKELVFSVNRFGSVYVIDEDTQAIVDGYYTNKPVEVSVTEINVDRLTLKEVSIDRNGDISVLKEGKDYSVESEGTDKSWKSFTYNISSENFRKDGRYSVMVYSEDRAGNKQDNRSEGKQVDFAVDTTAPSVVVSGLKNNGKYEEDGHEITIDVTDNMELVDLAVYSEEELLSSYSSEEIDDTIVIRIPAEDKPQDIYISASDAAGNITELKYDNIIVSADAGRIISMADSDKSMLSDGVDSGLLSKGISIRNVAIMIGSISLILVGMAVAVFFFIRKRK